MIQHIIEYNSHLIFFIIITFELFFNQIKFRSKDIWAILLIILVYCLLVFSLEFMTGVAIFPNLSYRKFSSYVLVSLFLFLVFCAFFFGMVFYDKFKKKRKQKKDRVVMAEMIL